PESQQGTWYEWLIAQELLRRKAIEGEEILFPLAFWQNQNHEVDFVASSNQFLEVKRGQAGVFEFQWFTKLFPQKKLNILNTKNFEHANILGLPLEEFMLSEN